MYEHNALSYRSGLALCLTKVRSSRASCPATALMDITLITVGPQLVILDYFCYMSIHFTLVTTRIE